MNAEEKKSVEKVGGFAFYLSIIALLLISVSNCRLIPEIISSTPNNIIFRFVGAIVIGICIGTLAEMSYLGVIIHELKHAVVSILVGNKPKGLNIKEQSGHYEYEYTKKTAHFNAMISLAPYWWPLFTIPIILLSLTSLIPEEACLWIVGISFGADLYMGLKDIGSHQSDLTMINGGYPVALSYIFLAHVSFGTTLTAWLLQGLDGLKYLTLGLAELVVIMIPALQNLG